MQITGVDRENPNSMSQWNIVRLELARTPTFPEGSASRAYMLRVPLDPEGLIDAAEIAKHPATATVRRFWPNEPDQTGYLIRNGTGWAFSYAVGEDDDEKLYHLGEHPLHMGHYVTISEPDGVDLPFRVTRSVVEGVPAV